MTTDKCGTCRRKVGRRGCRDQFCEEGRNNRNRSFTKSVHKDQFERVKSGELVLTSRGLERPPKAPSVKQNGKTG